MIQIYSNKFQLISNFALGVLEWYHQSINISKNSKMSFFFFKKIASKDEAAWSRAIYQTISIGMIFKGLDPYPSNQSNPKILEQKSIKKWREETREKKMNQTLVKELIFNSEENLLNFNTNQIWNL